jgi:Holliday junction resolvasome RuvABC endonuclease subunit
VQQVVGMARVIAFSLGVKFVQPTPAQAKAVLAGIPRTASKAQVQRAVRAVVRDCPKVMSEHASDAIATALAGARMVR